MTAKQVANEARLSKNTLTQWGKPHPRVQIDKVAQLAAFLGVSVPELVGPVPGIGEAAPRHPLPEQLDAELRRIEDLLASLESGAPDLLAALEAAQRFVDTRHDVLPLASAADQLRRIALQLRRTGGSASAIGP